jgi:YfiH family protein
MKDLYIDILKNVNGIKAFFSTKHGASNGSPYYHQEALEQLGMEDKILAQPQQVHEAKIGIIGENDCRIIDEAGDVIQAWSRGEEGPVIEAWSQGGKMVAENPELADPAGGAAGQAGSHIRFPRTDGVITDVKGVLLTTVHADCLPVWLYDEEHHAIGLVHAGWRGTLAGIAPKAVKLMQENYGSDPAKMKAAIGPGISMCCFETGPEVIEAFSEVWDFADYYAETAEEHFGDDEIPESAEGKYYIDLKGINTEELLEAGLQLENIEISRHCTHCEPETFASYRREGGTYMRMGAGICLE